MTGMGLTQVAGKGGLRFVDDAGNAMDSLPTSGGGNAGADGSTTITAGGTAQNLFSGATPTNGFLIANPDAGEDIWFSDSTTAAANATGSILLPAGGYYETPPGYKPVGAVSVVAATTGHKITARRW